MSFKSLYFQVLTAIVLGHFYPQLGEQMKPLFYAVSAQDRTINPNLQRFMAKRMGAKTIEIEASHLALISHPDAITNLILEALAV